MPDFTRPLGDTVRKARLEAGLSQRGVADKLNLDVRTILNIENYKGNPKMEVLFPLIRALHIDPGEIFYPESQWDSPAFRQFQLLMADCSEEEIIALLSVCKSVLSVFHSKNGISIE